MELAEFLENDGRDITGRAIALQEKLEGHTAESKVTLAPISNRFSNEKKENGPLQLQATINNTSTQRSSMSVVCRNWQRDGNCRFGQRCWFSHAIQDRGKRAKAEGEEKQRKEKAERERQEREMAERERVERERLERERAEQERVERERLERERLKRERLERERAERERVEKEKAERVARERIQADARRRDEDPRPHPRISNKPAREHENKKCPRCSISIAKTKGYNHAKCKCGAHICWICLGYVTGGTIYQHIRNAHEGRIFDPAALDGANRGSTEVDKDALRAAQKREAERAERERRALEAQQQLARAQKAAKRREEEARAAQRSEARRREQEEQASKELRIRENQEHSARLQAALAMLSRAARRSEALRKEQEEQAREELRIRENQERIARLQAAPAAVARLAEEEKRRREEGGWCIIM
ncbi:hypothetical protein BJ912DRAFT_179924 [Pholiota molesta]|nr:hypothetical protein BJ912DRAFT_179924 [Pholiota molesta]